MRNQQKKLHWLVGCALAVSVLLTLAVAGAKETDWILFYFIDDIPICFHVDALGKLFAVITGVIWLAAGIYALQYMEQEGKEKQFFGWYLLVYIVMLALDFAGNLVTLYFFYELMTLTSMPLVLHSGSKEAVMAALKYLFYSMFGAYLALFGIYFLYQYCDSLTFTAGGTLGAAQAAQHTGTLQIAVMALLIGFGTKAGMFPLHAWLTAAHPAAPAPASAVLSAIIVKGGVLAVIRSVYYVVGADFLRGTWVQKAWMTLTLLTILMGSLLAYRENVFKKRLAYSTISQVSYILFGLSLLTPTAVTGALLHVIFHACIKCALFFAAGIFIFRTGKTEVTQYAGIGRQMELSLWSYTFAALALIGIPPTSGFLSKWYLAQGALEADVGPVRIIGPAVLLVSALLTAGYLLPVTLNGFLPGKRAGSAETDAVVLEGREPLDKMNVVLLILAALSVLLGMIPGPLIRFVQTIAEMLV